MANRKWYGIQPDSKERKEELENITAFGYQCKLFRDDEKAAYIDRGKHLIPWMGDASLMIDRYDGRGSLYDLKPYDADTCPKEEPTREEIEMENIIDEERYLELHTDMLEKETYEEEEMKRLNEALQANSYGAVAFNYTSQGQTEAAGVGNEEATKHQVAQDPDEVEEELFEPSPELQLPSHIIAPKTLKQNAIIEKTAGFVAKQGNQMEIVIKTKQKDNAQFDFLNYENILNRYYKHMIKMIKNGRYVPKPQAPRPRKTSQSEGDAYLHPSLRNTAPELEPQTSESFLASVKSKLPAGQIANTAYAKLLNNMRRHTPTSRSNSPAPPQPQPQQSQQVVHHQSAPVSYSTSQVGPAQQRYADNTSPYSFNSQQPPVPGMEPVQLPATAAQDDAVPPGTEMFKSTPPVTGRADPAVAGGGDGIDGVLQGPQPMHGPQMPAYQPSESLHSQAAVYGPAHHTPCQTPPPPPPDIQPIIDKMANYVARNGLEFEVTVRNKNDPRFEFLQDWHTHHAYYLMKKNQIKKELEEEKERQKQNQNRSVSFSIKTKEVEPSSMGKGASMGADSDSEEDLKGADGEKMIVANNDGVAMPTSNPPQLVDYPVSKPKPAPAVTAEDALKNKLAAAAREKLITASKEDHVKAERKRKAAMFAAMLKGGPSSSSSSTSVTSNSAAATALPASQQQPVQPILGPQLPAPQPQTTTPTQTHTELELRPVQGPTLPPALGMISSRLHNSSRSPSPSVKRSTPSRSSRSRRSRSRSRSRDRRKSRYGRSRSRSRSYSPRRRRSRTPPSGYSKRLPTPNRASSPHRSKPSKRSRSRTRRSRSRTRRSASRSKRSRSRSRTHKSSSLTHSSGSKKHRSHRSQSRSRSRAKSSRKRSRSGSRKRSHRSRSKSKSKSKSKRSKDKEEKKSSKSGSKKSKSKDLEDGEIKKEKKSWKSTEDSASSSSDDESSPERKAKKEKTSDSESETEKLRQAALDSETVNLRKKALESNGVHSKIKEEECEEIEDGELPETTASTAVNVKTEPTKSS